MQQNGNLSLGNVKGLYSNNSRKFIVGVVGTQNTGKSTFIGDILEKFKGSDNEFNVVGCDYRKIIEKEGLSINREGNLQSQKIIFNALVGQLNSIKGYESGNYIMDRSPIDAYVYTVYLYRHNPALGITETDINDMFTKMESVIGGYDRIIFLDLENCKEVKVVDDRFRDTDLEYRSEIDKIFKETFAKLGLKFNSQILNSKIKGTRKERVNSFISMEGSQFVVPC